jgi:hypothetical protein
VDFDAPPNDGGSAITSYSVTAYRDAKPVMTITKPMTAPAPVPITLKDLSSGDVHTFTRRLQIRLGPGRSHRCQMGRRRSKPSTSWPTS